ncbi:MAG: NAD(P)-dependent oxidoreductase, partial [Ramlibacter sp.]
MARIVISEFMDERAVAQLCAAHDVLYAPELVDKPAELIEAAGGCDALIVRNRTQVRGELVAALGRCRVLGRLGVGLDNIDVPACEARGMKVIPATGANALSVAEYVIAASMLLLRGAFASTASMAQGQWPRAALGNGRETAGKTLGIIGFGSIGQTVARLAGGLGMEVIAFDTALDAGDSVFRANAAAFMGLDSLVRRADVVTLHVPLVDGTRGLFNASRIAAMKKGAILINTSRGQIVDAAAVAAALKSGALGGAALDVFDVEPLPATPAF